MEKKRMNLMEFMVAHPSKTKAPPKRGATEKQISFAKAIAETLDLECPDFSDFNDTSAFISYNKDDYYAAKDEEEDDDTSPFYGFDYDAKGRW